MQKTKNTTFKNSNIKILAAKTVTAFLIGISLLTFAGCGKESNGGSTAAGYDTGFIPAYSGNYDSRDTAVVISKNTGESTITFKNLELGKYYTLNYDGATAYFDKYGQALSLEQVRCGDIVSIDFLHRAKRLDSLRVSGDAFSYDWVEEFTLDPKGSSILMNNEVYSIPQDVVVIKEDGLGDMIDINEADVLRISGYGHTIASIVIERGHGYLRLINDSFFVGGFLEVSRSKIYRIDEDMLLPVPVGTYEVTVSNKGCSGTESITIRPNEEYELDVSPWQGEASYGILVFTVNPENARVYIDGRVVDISEEQELSYGIHQMVVMAEGYKTISKYIKVSEAYSNMDIVMELDLGEADAPSVSNNNVSDNNVSDNSVSGNSVSGNGVSDNSVSGNGVSGNQVSSNTASGNSVSGNGTGNTGNSGSTGNNSNTGNNGNTGNSGSSGTTSSPQHPVTTSGYQVTIEGPEGVEVYKDGMYIGLAPVSFPKQEGSYVIILRANGYQTRSYTITVDDSAKDISYSFSALLPIL